MTREPPSNYVDGNGNSAHDCITQEIVRAAFESSPASLKCYLGKHPDGQYRVAHTQNVFKDFCAGYEARAALSQPSVQPLVSKAEAVAFARQVVENIRTRWYGDLRGNANVEQMDAILSDTEESIINYLAQPLNTELARLRKQAQAILAKYNVTVKG